MFEQASAGEPRNVLGDWALRGFIGIVAVFVGWDKFPGGTEWVQLFRQIGLGQWFRYFTGAVEILGGVLVLIPRTTVAGLGLLSITMAAASVISVVVHPSTFLIPGVLSLALGAYAWSRWRS